MLLRLLLLALVEESHVLRLHLHVRLEPQPTVGLKPALLRSAWTADAELLVQIVVGVSRAALRMLRNTTQLLLLLLLSNSLNTTLHTSISVVRRIRASRHHLRRRLLRLLRLHLVHCRLVHQNVVPDVVLRVRVMRIPFLLQEASLVTSFVDLALGDCGSAGGCSSR